MLAILVSAACVTGYGFLKFHTNPNRIRQLTVAYLQNYLNGVVEIGEVEFSWADGVTLHDVALFQPGITETDSPIPQPGETESSSTGLTLERLPIFSCREVKITHDLMAALSGTLKIHSIVAKEPTCRIVRDRILGTTNLTGLLKMPTTETSRRFSHLPTVEMTGVRVEVISREASGDRLVDQLTLTLRARPSIKFPSVYEIVWRDQDQRVASGHSQIDLNTGRISNQEGGLPWMSIEAVMLAIDAGYDGVGAWSDLLGIGGKLRVVDYHGWDSSDSVGLKSATVELLHAHLSIPISDEERHLSPEQRYLRFEQVVGQVRFTHDGLQAEFEGLFHGSQCQVTASFSSQGEPLKTLDHVNFEAKLTLQGLTLPRIDLDSALHERRFVQRFDQLAQFYRSYDPHGIVDLELEVSKQAGTDELIVLRHALLKVRDGDASCRFFPYRGYHIQGIVEVTSDGVWIRDIISQHDGGQLRVNGKFDRPTREAAKQVVVEATNFALDDALFEALPGKFRALQGQLEPSGKADAVIHITQMEVPPGEKPIWKSETVVQLRDVSIRYEEFSYPLEQLNGELHIGMKQLEIRAVEGKAGSGQVRLDGYFTLGQRQHPDFTLSVQASDVTIDDTLLDALPKNVQPQVKPFNLRGRIGVTAMYSRTYPNEDLNYDIEVRLTEATVRHNEFPVDVTDVEGRLSITPDQITFHKMLGQYGEATIKGEGAINIRGDQSSVEFTVQTTNLHLDESLQDALPPSFSEALSTWRIDQPVATETKLTFENTELTGMNTRVTIQDAVIHHPLFPIPFEDVQAELHIHGDRVYASDITARYGSARLEVDLDLRHGTTQPHGVLKINATGMALDESTISLLPDRLTAGWDHASTHGTVDLFLEALSYTQHSPDQPLEWSVSGSVELHDVTLFDKGRLDHLSGTLAGSGLLYDRDRGTTLNGELALHEGRIAGHHISHGQTPWTYVRTERGEGAFNLPEIQARLYDGFLNGSYELLFEETGKTRYSLTANLHGVRIASFLNRQFGSDASADRSVEVSGVTDGHLYLSGLVGQSSTRQGGGRFVVHEAKLYRMPLILAILHVLNLSIPQGEAFDDARAEFFIMGNRIQLKNIVLRGKALALVGYGHMTLPDRGVDLELVNVSPHQWTRVPVLTELMEGASRELVELHVTGPIDQPRVRVRPLPGLQKEFDRLFQKRRIRKVPPSVSRKKFP